MEINIKKDCYGHMMATEGAVLLFEFEFRNDSGAWFFWMPGRQFDPCVIPGKKFPKDYFFNACRAVHFIRKDTGIDESVTVTGMKHTIIK